MALNTEKENYSKPDNSNTKNQEAFQKSVDALIKMTAKQYGVQVKLSREQLKAIEETKEATEYQNKTLGKKASALATKMLLGASPTGQVAALGKQILKQSGFDKFAKVVSDNYKIQKEMNKLTKEQKTEMKKQKADDKRQVGLEKNKTKYLKEELKIQQTLQKSKRIEIKELTDQIRDLRRSSGNLIAGSKPQLKAKADLIEKTELLKGSLAKKSELTKSTGNLQERIQGNSLTGKGKSALSLAGSIGKSTAGAIGGILKKSMSPQNTTTALMLFLPPLIGALMDTFKDFLNTPLGKLFVNIGKDIGNLVDNLTAFFKDPLGSIAGSYEGLTAKEIISMPKEEAKKESDLRKRNAISSEDVKAMISAMPEDTVQEKKKKEEASRNAHSYVFDEKGNVRSSMQKQQVKTQETKTGTFGGTFQSYAEKLDFTTFVDKIKSAKSLAELKAFVSNGDFYKAGLDKYSYYGSVSNDQQISLLDKAFADKQSELEGKEKGKLEAKAKGGAIRSGVQYMVGEQGPELFTSQTNGSIIPSGNSMFSGSQGLINKMLEERKSMASGSASTASALKAIENNTRNDISNSQSTQNIMGGSGGGLGDYSPTSEMLKYIMFTGA